MLHRFQNSPVVGGRPVRYLNVDMETLKKAAVDMIKGNHAVWFGCDVGQMLETEMGAMDLNVYDYKIVYGTDFKLDKADCEAGNDFCFGRGCAGPH